MARFTSLLIFAAAVLPFAFATTSDQCSDIQFFYPDKECCLPYGGTSNTTTPPLGSSQCPSNGWYWHDGKECCVPEQPVEQNPPPQCGGGWEWNSGSSTCCQSSTTTTSVVATPSAAHRKRNLKSRAAPLCPNDMEACPILGLGGLTGDYECLDTTAELESCGGCASTGAGQNCMTIEGVWNVGCERSTCKVYSCAQGYKRSADGLSCVAL